MKYICVKWIHSFSTEPVLMYSELDENRWEHRKVEIFADGRRDYASESKSKGSSALGKVPLPPFDQIMLDPQFQLVEISKGQFEQVWLEAHG